MTPTLLFRQRWSRTSSSLTFPVVPPTRHAEARQPAEHRGPLLSQRANAARLMGPERLPPTDPSEEPRSRETSADGCHRCPRFATRARRPVRVHAHAVCARRASTRLFAACRRATYRRSTSAIRTIREHTHEPPKHRHSKRRTAMASVDGTPKGTTGRAVNRPGAARLSVAHSAPTKTTARLGGFTPT